MKKIQNTLFLAFCALTLGLGNCKPVATNASTPKVIEIVKLRPAPNVTDQQMQTAFETMNVFVKKQKGFQSRTFGVTKDGTWFDIVAWDSLEDAEAATKASELDPTLGSLFALFDEKTIEFNHVFVR